MFLSFLPQYQRQSMVKEFFFPERELKKALRDTLTRAAWFVIFDWFVLSLQVILDSLFARPGLAPAGGLNVTPNTELASELHDIYGQNFNFCSTIASNRTLNNVTCLKGNM